MEIRWILHLAISLVISSKSATFFSFLQFIHLDFNSGLANQSITIWMWIYDPVRIHWGLTMRQVFSLCPWTWIWEHAVGRCPQVNCITRGLKRPEAKTGETRSQGTRAPGSSTTCSCTCVTWVLTSGDSAVIPFFPKQRELFFSSPKWSWYFQKS